MNELIISLKNKISGEIEFNPLEAGKEDVHDIFISNTEKYAFIGVEIKLIDGRGMLLLQEYPKTIPANSKIKVTIKSSIPLDIDTPLNARIEVTGKFLIK